MDEIRHRTVAANGLQMHVAELGEGPTVLFVHGFPELWYSWRHQMSFLAARGYRAVAPDLRGFGDTTGAPIGDASKFTVVHLVGDLIALLDAIAPDEGKVFVVGHDWGAVVTWQLCLYRPDRVKALVNLSVPLSRRNPDRSIVDALRKAYGDDYYVIRFQEPGEIEAEFAEIGFKQVFKNIFAYRTPGPLYLPKGKGFGYSADRPSWLTEEDLDYFVTKFQQSGFTGGVNYYRAWPLSWELDAAWADAKVNVPTKFIVGDLDLTYHNPGVKELIHGDDGFKGRVPSLKEVVVVEDAGHFINQEKPDLISQHIYAFLEQY
ncbi:epoxide hydrolase [Genlisea aurea]|uniref:soluble epoxide hydrolase n=1 Tax=Genlisea aurea TaxID=192259 RepID=S8E221_9LAMI|nr:epoxide hydrolase [Genlisea aurea]